jgi:hypothetical protein
MVKPAIAPSAAVSAKDMQELLRESQEARIRET